MKFQKKKKQPNHVVIFDQSITTCFWCFFVEDEFEFEFEPRLSAGGAVAAKKAKVATLAGFTRVLDELDRRPGGSSHTIIIQT